MEAEVTLKWSADLKEKLARFRDAWQSWSLSSEKVKQARVHLAPQIRTEHIYHSTGIEGNRLNWTETQEVLAASSSSSFFVSQDTLEVQGLASAFDHLQLLIDSPEPLREIDIRDLHRLLLPQGSLGAAGAYRQIPVKIAGAVHVPPPACEVPQRLKLLIEGLARTFPEDPLLRATLVHYELAAIHPFVDGNGRVARLLMNWVLGKAGYPFCNLRREDRPQYYLVLREADCGNFEPLVELVLGRVAELGKVYQTTFTSSPQRMNSSLKG